MRSLLRRGRQWIEAAREDDLFLYAAALAFYGLISVAPLVVVALWVTTLVVGEVQVRNVADDLARLAPRQIGVDRALVRLADLGTTLGLLAVLAALWPATAYGSALARLLDRLTGTRDAAGLRRRGAALLLVAVVPILVFGTLVAGLLGSAALGDRPVEVAIGLALALVLSFAATVATVALIYKVFPRRPPAWRAALRGAFVAGGSIATLSVAYVAYLCLGANFEQGYASDALASVVLLGVWLFAANVGLLAGYRVASGHQAPTSGR